MFFILSKLIYWVAMPMSIVIFTLVGAWIVKDERLSKRLFGIGVGLLLFFTNPLLAKWAMNVWENDAIPYDQIAHRYTYGVVLTGVTNLGRPPFDRIQFNKGADRIIQAIELYKRGFIKNILISGGNGGLPNNQQNEGVLLSDFAIRCGVLPQHILIDSLARNTHENAKNSVYLIQPTQARNILLITSAFHIPRASLCFQKEGLLVDSFPTDHYGGPIFLTPNGLFIPSIEALQTWTILFKEWLGLAAYRLMGYI